MSDHEPPLLVIALRGQVIALRAADGAEAWRATVSISSAVRLQVSAEVVLALDAGALVALDYATGRTLWRCDGGGETLLAVGSRAFVSSSGVVSCIDVGTGAPLWRNELPGT